MSSHTKDVYVKHPAAMRWTHIALPATNIDKTIDWYTRFTPLELLDRREDTDGQGAWLGHPDQGDKPFVLVLVSFTKIKIKVSNQSWRHSLTSELK